MFDRGKDSGWCIRHEHALDGPPSDDAAAALRTAAKKGRPAATTTAQLERHVESMERLLVDCYRRIADLTARVESHQRPQALHEYLDHLAKQQSGSEAAAPAVSPRLIARFTAGLDE